MTSESERLAMQAAAKLARSGVTVSDDLMNLDAMNPNNGTLPRLKSPDEQQKGR